jgi:cardiolipin synthase
LGNRSKLPGGNILNAANVLTVFRLLLVPVFGYFLHMENYQLAVFLFLFSGLTDILDGYIARKYKMVTAFGKLADPIADKLMLITALILLSSQNIIFSPVTIIVAVKETLMGIGMIILKKRNIMISASWYGKLATVIFYFAITSFILVRRADFFKNSTTDLLINVLVIIVVLATLFAFFMYSLKYYKIIKKE